MIDTIAPTEAEIDADRWLAAAGFRFNPFTYLDAGADPHISAYLVGHEAFAALWNDRPAIMFAPAGGGKTAQRVILLRACWAGPNTGHPFPIPYIPTLSSSGAFPATEAEHLEAILRAGALSLLMALLLRPHWWTALDSAARRLVAGLLDRDLPAPLSYYLAQVQETGSLASLWRGCGMAVAPTVEPPATRWLPLCAELDATPVGSPPVAAAMRLQALADLLLGPLGLSSLYLLVDGIDGFVETAADPQAAVAMLAPLLAHTEDWAAQRLLLKGFFPIEIVAALDAACPEMLQQIRRVILNWSPPQLADVIRQRVWVATEGGFGSLDALCSPGLRDAETQLARIIAPLPREILVLTARLLWEHVRRGDANPKLTPADLQAAAAWYEEQRPPNAQPALVAA
jgi:hypothetical protein